MDTSSVHYDVPTPSYENGVYNAKASSDNYDESEDLTTGNDNMHSYSNAEFVEMTKANVDEPRKHNKENSTHNIFSMPRKDSGKRNQKMLYEIDDIPSWYMTIFLGFQHYLLMAGTTTSLPLFLMPKMCMKPDDPDMGKIISTYLFVSGIITIIQSTFGTRLPIVQGGSFAYLLPAVAILESERWKCQENLNPDDYNAEVWKPRMRELQGAIIMASIFQTLLGFFGVFGYIMKAITPITLASSIIFIGLSLFEAATFSAAKSWPTALATLFLVILFSQYLREVKIPVPFTKSKKRPGMKRYPMFQIFPVLLSIVVVWTVCGILTASNAIPKGNAARTDSKIDIITYAKWFFVPYPFQWGRPTFTMGAAIGFLSAVFAGIVESLGDYQAVARIVKAPKPPVHIVNRGVFMEGIGCLLTGIFGTGNGTTSYSENVGAMTITKVGSRRVVQTAGFIMMVFSLIGKVGAFFVSVPEPIIGGTLCVTFSMIIAIGLSNLQNVDLTSARNTFILGFSIFFSMAVSKWVATNENAINIVGWPSLSFTIQILLRTGMFLAALTSLFLDNTIPGTLKERGFITTEVDEPTEGGINIVDGEEVANVTYDLPFGMKFIRRYGFTSWIPISPTFNPSNYSGLFRRRKSLSS